MLAEIKKAVNAAANSNSWYSLAGCVYPVARRRHYPNIKIEKGENAICL